MNHKHISVILEDHDYSGLYDTWDVINDLIDYADCVKKGDSEDHYVRCISNKNKVTDDLSNGDVARVVKLALEYNASIITVCTAYYGNMDSKKNGRKFIDNLKKVGKEYDDMIKKIVEE